MLSINKWDLIMMNVKTKNEIPCIEYVYYDGQLVDVIKEMWTQKRIDEEISKLQAQADICQIDLRIERMHGRYYISIFM